MKVTLQLDEGMTRPTISVDCEEGGDPHYVEYILLNALIDLKYGKKD